MLGGIRGVAQTISYEISFAIIIISIMTTIISINLSKMYFTTLGAIIPISLIILLISLIAETNRTPFDFSEGERELVSGFNIEYRGVGFVLIFLAEYARIIFVCVLLNVFIIGFSIFSAVSSATRVFIT